VDFKVASSIYRKTWLIENQSALRLLDLLEQIKAGSAKFEKEESAHVQLFANANVIAAPIDTYSARNHPGYDGKTIAILPINGALMKEDFCGWFGTASLKNELNRISSTESIQTVLLLIDSPGGTVDGTQALADAIKASPKQTIAVIDGMACSAAYWIASSADKIVATSRTDIIGSIGTMISFYDQTERLAEQGIVLREFYADASKDKNKMFSKAKQGDGKLLVSELLNPMNDIFLSSVKANRGDKLNEKETLSGKTFLAEQAQAYGLIDEVSSLDTTINNLLNNTSTKMKIKATFTAILAFLGISAAAGSDSVELNEDQLNKIEAALPELASAKAKVAELETAAATAKEQVTALTTERDNAQAEVTAAKEKITALEAEVAKLGALDGAKPTTVTGEQDKFNDNAEAIDPMEMPFQKEILSRI
jgi:signal peptide peptidase SppA